ncbi:MAG: ATP-dependent helicase, partial [Variovorax sp.]
MADLVDAMPASQADLVGMALDLALSPAGRVYLEIARGVTAAPASPAASRVRKAFERGGAHGLLQLGAVELGGALSPALAFGREFAHLFMVRLTALATLAEAWASVELPAPRAELEQLAAAAPPMTGAEYLNGAVLDAWWVDLHRAVREEIAAGGGEVDTWLRGKHPGWNLVGRVCFHLA